MLSEQTTNISAPNRRLDLLTFSVSGLRDGLGPLLGVFLIQKTHFDAFEVSCVLSAAGATNLLLQIPIGHIYDKAKKPHLLIGIGGVSLAVSCFLVSIVPPYPVALLSQALVGVGGCLLSVGLPALSVLCTKTIFVRGRLARNEIFSKLGNFCSIGLMGFLSQRFNLHWMFYVIYLAAALVFVNCLKSFPQIESANLVSECHSKIRVQGAKAPVKSYFRDILCNPTLVPILIVGFIYQFANASLFMIFEQQFVRQQINGGVGIISSTLLVTQLTIIFCCLLLVRSSREIEINASMRIGMVLIAARGLVLLLNTSIISLFASQVLDGVIAALIIVLPVSAIARFAGSNFNRMSATFGMVVVGAASLSTLCSGYVIVHCNFACAYVVLICAALLGVVLTSLFSRKE